MVCLKWWCSFFKTQFKTHQKLKFGHFVCFAIIVWGIVGNKNLWKMQGSSGKIQTDAVPYFTFLRDDSSYSRLSLQIFLSWTPIVFSSPATFALSGGLFNQAKMTRCDISHNIVADWSTTTFFYCALKIGQVFEFFSCSCNITFNPTISDLFI